VSPKPAAPAQELTPAELHWCCLPEKIPFQSTNDVAPLETIVGQDRALKALRVGVELFAPGYNIFVCGLAGTGRATTITKMLQELPLKCPLAPDRCYVNNFKSSDQPRLLTLPRGQANGFRKEMDSAIAFLRRRIPQVFESEQFQLTKNKIVERYTGREKEMMDEFTRYISKNSFMLAKMQVGTVSLPELFPVVDGQMVPMEEMPKLVEAGKVPAERAKEFAKKYDQFRQEFTLVYRKTLALSRELAQDLRYLEQESASVLVDGVIEELKEKFPHPRVSEYLEEVRHNILDNLEPFKTREEEAAEAEGGAPSVEEAFRGPRFERDPFRVYQVNAILAHEDGDGAPVIFERSPTYHNLFGTVQRPLDWRAAVQSDFMDIRAGSLLRADGGYLVVYALDALTEPGVWRALKRTLMHRKLEIQATDWLYSFGGSSLKPEPIDVNVKVIMIGDHELYELLYAYEQDFKKIFKIKADFDSEMKLTDNVVGYYAGAVRKLCDEEKLRPFDRSAISALVEFGVRRAGRKGKVTTRFADVLDVAREAHYFAEAEQSAMVTEAHVRRAREAHRERHNLIESKIQEMIDEHLMLIDVAGSRVGQVNGLSVAEVGGYAFGRPVRITASVSMGKAGIINIEREANLSGKLHDKGIQILAGYLRNRFAQDKPLSLSGSICFEQSYTGVDGDSASSTEIYAIVSALARVPLRQEIAVTGSVNQQGDVQAIGGVNQKIEGFFEVCKGKGLTGSQGVIIPQDNVKDLMLREDIVQAVAQNQFHIYPITTVDQGIEILTGFRAGTPGENGKFEEDTVNALADARLLRLAKELKEFE